MSRTTTAVAATTNGIDTGKNTLHLIGSSGRGRVATVALQTLRHR
jgi:hypothetical protein